jgi:hypothetical protein
VAIGLSWPEGLETENLDPEIAAIFRRQQWAGLPDFFVLEKDGKPFQWRVLSTSKARVGDDEIVIPGLPVGRYLLKLRSSDDIAARLPKHTSTAKKHGEWKQAEVTFVVTESSPEEISLTDLKIELAN